MADGTEQTAGHCYAPTSGRSCRRKPTKRRMREEGARLACRAIPPRPERRGLSRRTMKEGLSAMGYPIYNLTVVTIISAGTNPVASATVRGKVDEIRRDLKTDPNFQHYLSRLKLPEVEVLVHPAPPPGHC